jgi:hypothetical protein
MAAKAHSQGNANKQTVDAAVVQAVHASCDAIKASVQQYRTTLDLVCTGQYGVARIPRDLADFTCRLVCLTGELGTNWLDLLAACVSGSAPAGSAQPPPAAQDGAAGTPGTIIRLASRKIAQVTLSPLTPTSPVVVPVVIGLHSVDPTLPAINTLRFSAAPGRSQLVLNIRISDNQPAGIYSGLVIDSDTNQPIGTLTIRIHD